MATDVKDILRRSKEAFQRLLFMQELYRDAYRLGAPNREGFESVFGIQTPGETKQREVYDSTMQDAVERLANAYYIGAFPPGSRWQEFVAGTSVQEDQIDEINEKLQYPTKIVKDSLLATNFYTQIHPFLVDFIFGTGCMEISENEKKDVLYTAIPPYQLGLEPGEDGSVGATFRRHKVGGRAFEAQFPNAVIPKELQQQLDASPDADVEIISAVIPEVRGLRNYMQYVIWEPGSAILEERMFFENPRIVARHSVLTGEIYGRGPALKSTATAYSLNECAKLMLMAANMGIFGMWTVTDDGINPDTFQIGSAALIPVESNLTTNPSMAPLGTTAQMDAGQFEMDDLRSQIKRNMAVDQLGNVEGAKATAYEISERQALVLQDMGAAFGRLMAEFSDPVITRHAGILSRKIDEYTLQPKLPQIKVDGKLIAIRYSSPLARAQNAEELNAMRALREENAEHAAIDQTEAARLDRGKMQKRQAQLTGIDMDFVRSDEEVQEIANAIAAAQTAMADTEMAA